MKHKQDNTKLANLYENINTMKDTNNRTILDAFARAFDEMGDEAFQRIADAYDAFAKRQGGATVSPLHNLVKSEFALRNQSMDHDA